MANAIVILQHDPARAERLLATMKSVSSSVRTVHSVAELKKLA
jgi:hypothetical protein